MTSGKNYSGSYMTNTVITAPSSALYGSSIDINTTTYSDSTRVKLGRTQLVEFNNEKRLGQSLGSGSIDISNPAYSFILDNPMKIIAIKIPITNLVNSSNFFRIDVSLTSNSTTILSGYIDNHLIPHALSDGYLIFSISTVQTDPYSFPDGVPLSANTEYILQLTLDNAYFTIPISNINDNNIHLLNNGSVVSGSPNLVFYEGKDIGIIVGGTANFKVNITQYSVFFAYYWDIFNVYAPSYAEHQVDVYQNTGQTIDIDNISTETGKSITLYAYVHNTNPLSGIPVTFSIQIYGYYEIIGYATTQTNGYAYFDTIIDYKPGNYSYRVNSSDTFVYGILTVLKPHAKWVGALARGEYNSHGTIVTIDGYLKSMADQTIDDKINVTIPGKSWIVNTINGYFKIEYNSSLSIGTYSNYVNLHYYGTYWSVDDITINLEIYKSTPIMQIETVYANYSEPVIGHGNITSESGDKIITDIRIFYNNDSLITQVTANGEFNFTLPKMELGNYLLYAMSTETDIYKSQITYFNLIVGSATAYLNRDDGNTYLPTSVEIPYGHNEDLSIHLTNRLGEEIAGIKISLNMTKPLLDINKQIMVSTTNSTGWATFYWIPDGDWINLHHMYLTAVYTIISDEFETVQYSLPVKIISNYLNISYVLPKTFVDKEFSINVTTTAEGSVFNLTIYAKLNGITQYKQTDINGNVIFHFTINTTGTFNIAIGYSSGIVSEFPYYDTETVQQLYIRKGSYTITTDSDVVSLQGQEITFTAGIKTHSNINAQTDVYLYYFSGEWILLNHQYILNGTYNYQILTTQQPSNYLFKLYIPGNNNYNSSELIGHWNVSASYTRIIDSNQHTFNYGIQNKMQFRLEVPYIMNLTGQNIAISLEQSNWTLKTDSQGLIYLSLPQYLPVGNYQLIVHYFGNNTYQASNYSTLITIIGTDINIQWIIPPDNVYYGETLSFTLRVTDPDGNGIDGLELIVTIGTISMYIDTNSSGYAMFNLIMLEIEGNSSNVEINVTSPPSYGWNGGSINYEINVSKRSLSLQTTLSGSYVNNTSQGWSIVYGTIADLLIHFNSSDAFPKVDFNIYFGYDNLFTLLGTYQTNNSGYITIYNITSLLYPIGNNFKLLINTTQSWYIPIQQIYYINVISSDVILDYNVDNAIFGINSTITVNVFDLSHNPIKGILVTITHMDTTLWLNVTLITDENGQVIFNYQPPYAGDIYLSIHIIGINGKYKDTQKLITYNVEKAYPTINAILHENNAQLEISLYINGHKYSIKMDTYIQIWVYSNSWELITTYNLYTNPLYHLDITNSEMLFKAILTENNNMYSSHITFEVKQVNINISSSDISSLYGDNISVPISITKTDVISNITVINDINLYNFRFYYLLDDGSWKELYPVSSSYKFDTELINIYNISQQLDVGTYTIMVVFPAQSLYTANTLLLNLEIKANTPMFTISTTEFKYLGQTRITINVYDIMNKPISVNFTLQIFNNTWIDISYLTSIDGTVSTDIFLAFPVGNYQFRILFDGNENYNSANYLFDGYIRDGVHINIGIINPVYTDNGSIIIQLLENTTNQAVANESISLYWIRNPFSSPELLQTSITNKTGYVVFNIPEYFKPGKINLIVKHDRTELYSSISDKFSIIIEPETVSISVQINDMGITLGMNITISVIDEAGPINHGTIVIQLQDVQTEIILNDSFTEYTFHVNGYLIGKYPLDILFSDSDGWYSPTHKSVDIGYQKISDINIQYPHEIKYNNNFSIHLSLNNSLSGLNLSIENKQYISDNNGNVTIKSYQMNVGEYQLSIIIDSPILEHSITKIIRFSIIPVYIPLDFNYEQNENKLQVTINDKMYNQSTYTIIIANTTELYRVEFFMNSSSDIINIPISNIWPSNYTLSLIRKNPNLITFEKDQIISISPRNISIDLNVSFDNDNSTIIIAVILNNQLFYYGQYTHLNLTMSIFVNETYVQTIKINSSDYIIIQLRDSGTLSLNIDARGYYYGHLYREINFDFTDTTQLESSGSFNLNDVISYTIMIATTGSIAINKGKILLKRKLEE